MSSQEEITAHLKESIDPELQMNIVDLGLIYDIALAKEKGTVAITWNPEKLSDEAKEELGLIR